MLRYDIDPTRLERSNRDLVISSHRLILTKLLDLVTRHLDTLEADAPPTDEDAIILREQFHVLFAMALQYGLEAGDLAARLGVTVSTVHRWAKGTFVPPQLFVRTAAIRVVKKCLESEIEKLDHDSRTETFPKRYTTIIEGRHSGDSPVRSASVVGLKKRR